MTAINFPSSPSDGDTHVVGGVTYTYNNAETKWKTTINSNAFLPLTGGTVSGNIVLDGELQHSGDTDTKITFGTDTINLDTGGSTRATVDSSGRVGIGTSNPTRHLHIHEAATGTNAYLQLSNIGTGQTNTDGFQLICTDGGEAIVMQRENQPLSFYTNNTERARITSTGDLRFNSGYGSVTTVYGVRAWCYGDLVGTIAIHESGGVTSLTDSANGQFIVNFSFTFPDENYAVTGTATDGTGEANFLAVRTAGTNPVRSTTAISMEVYTYAGGRIDAEFGLAVLR